MKPRLVDPEEGIFYDELFEARQRGDYIELVQFDTKEVKEWLEKTGRFVEKIRNLIKYHEQSGR